MPFSHRMGLKPRSALQLGVMDKELRKGLWSVLVENVLRNFRGSLDGVFGRQLPHVLGSNLDSLFRAYWFSYLKIPTDTIPPTFDEAAGVLRNHFFGCKWNEVHDFVDFIIRQLTAPPPEGLTGNMVTDFNSVLDRENSGYRIINGIVTEITSGVEIAEIEQAISSPLAGVKTHLETSLGLLTDRKNPDYRNSIKESISAVESMCRTLTSDPNATAGAALNVIQDKVGLHGALKASLSNLYGYTSDEDGIRHAMLEKPDITFNDAKFLPVSCSAFVNYITGKTSESSLKMK